MLVFVVVIAAVVWLSMALHLILRERTPFLVLGWMPYRLINHAPLLVLVMICDILGRMKHGPVLLTGAVVYAAVAMFLPRELWLTRYLDPAVCVMFLLFGAAWACIALEEEGRRMNHRVAGVVLVLALALVHQWGAACVAVGAVLGVVTRGVPARRVVAWGACAVALALMLAVKAQRRDHLPRSSFDRTAASIMEDSGMMVAGRPDEFTLQARLKRPVLVESATASLISYMPELGPSINQIFGEFYGMRFDAASGSNWEVVWATRTPQEWRALGERYSVGYLAAPEEVDVDLELVFAEDGSRLFRIPHAEATP
jgi:hypothetical protein